MSTPTSPKSPCCTCQKLTGLFTCGGCRRDFCLAHVNEHRQELDKQIDELSLDHDQLRQNLLEQINDHEKHIAVKQIDEWAKESIEKIRQVAEEIKRHISGVVSKQLNDWSTTLTHLTEEIKQARENQSFFEKDIDDWRERLAQLKELLSKPNMIELQPAAQSSALIERPSLIMFDDDAIEQRSKHISLEDNARVILHKQHESIYGAARGRNEYFWGQHRFRLQIEALHNNKWFFVGIISKEIPLRDTSYSSSSSYGWAPLNQVFLNGKMQAGYRNYRHDVEVNDRLELVLDCDRQRIRLANERTHQTSELTIDLTHCPLPWKLNFNLLGFNDRIRLLSV